MDRWMEEINQYNFPCYVKEIVSVHTQRKYIDIVHDINEFMNSFVNYMYDQEIPMDEFMDKWMNIENQEYLRFCIVI